jgi:hypothetical protein
MEVKVRNHVELDFIKKYAVINCGHSFGGIKKGH